MGAKTSKTDQTYEYTIDEKLMLYEHWFNLCNKLELKLMDEYIELNRLTETDYLDESVVINLDMRNKQIKKQTEIIKEIRVQCNYTYSMLHKISGLKHDGYVMVGVY